MEKIKIVFMGTPDFAVPILKSLIENYHVVGVVTQPDKKVGRHQEIKYPPIKVVAVDNNITVLQPKNIREEYQEIIDLKPDIIITCAYGQIIPKELLDYPKYGCINVHASLLPKYRGGSPIHRAIINDDSKTGVTIMYMAEKMDAGDIISKKETIIEDNDTLETLHDRLSILGKILLLNTLPKIIKGEVSRIKQNEDEATFAYNITREDEKLDFNKTTREVYNKIRGLNPYPGSFTTLDGQIIKVYNSKMSDRVYTTKQNGEITAIYKDGIGVSVKDGEIILTEIKIAGKNKVRVKDYLNGIDKEKLLGKKFM